MSTTCSLHAAAIWPDGEAALLLVGVDPIDPELLDAPQDFPADRMAETLFPLGSDYLLVDDGRVRGGSPRAAGALRAPDIEEHGLAGLPEGGDGAMVMGGETLQVDAAAGEPAGGDAAGVRAGGGRRDRRGSARGWRGRQG